jgi:hypothetical protein
MNARLQCQWEVHTAAYPALVNNTLRCLDAAKSLLQGVLRLPLRAQLRELHVGSSVVLEELVLALQVLLSEGAAHPAQKQTSLSPQPEHGSDINDETLQHTTALNPPV